MRNLTDHAPASHRHSFLDTLEVLVGTAPNQERFIVHYDIVAKRSEFFRAARSERWTPGTKPTDLHEHDPETFDRYLHCVYHNELPVRPDPVGELPPDADRIRNPNEYREQQSQRTAAKRRFVVERYRELVSLYILADSLLDPITANLVIDQIAVLGWDSFQLPGEGLIKLAFFSTRGNDGLRKLLADFYIYMDETLPEGDFPKAFLSLVVERFLAAKAAYWIVAKYDRICEVQNSGSGSDWRTSEYYQQVDTGNDIEW